MLLALKRHVSSTSDHLKIVRSTLDSSNKLKFEKEKSSERASSESMVTSSEASMKEDVSEQDSGLEIDEIYGLKEEVQELKLENDKLQSEITKMTKEVEDQRAIIEERDESLQGSKRKCKMFEDHSSLLAFQIYELSEKREILEKGLRIREDQLEEMEVKHAEAIRKLNEEHNRKMIVKVLKIEELEEVIATVKKDNSELKGELRQMDIQSQVSEVMNEIIGECVSTTMNEDMSNCLKENTDVKNELSILKAEIEDFRSKMDESAKVLEESKRKCAMYEEQVCLLTSELREVSKVKANLENELSLMDAKLKVMKESNEENIWKITDEHNAKLIEEGLKMDFLQEEIGRYRKDQVNVNEHLKEMTVKLSATRIANDTIVDALTATYETETVRYQKEIEAFRQKIAEGDAVQKSLAEKARLSDLQLADANHELLDVKELFKSKVEDLLQDNTAAHIKFLEEQTDRINSSKAFRLRLDSVTAECRRLEEANLTLVGKTAELQVELNSRQKKIDQLDEQVIILYDRLGSKDLAIQQFLMKKRKRSGLRRIFCC